LRQGLSYTQTAEMLMSRLNEDAALLDCTEKEPPPAIETGSQNSTILVNNTSISDAGSIRAEASKQKERIWW